MNDDTNRPVQRDTNRPVQLEKRAWYNQGWFWLIVAVCFLGVIIAGLFLLSGEIGGVSTAVRQQTEVQREQNGLLSTIGHQLNQLSAATNRIAGAIRDAVSQLLAAI